MVRLDEENKTSFNYLPTPLQLVAHHKTPIFPDLLLTGQEMLSQSLAEAGQHWGQ